MIQRDPLPPKPKRLESDSVPQAESARNEPPPGAFVRQLEAMRRELQTLARLELARVRVAGRMAVERAALGIGSAAIGLVACAMGTFYLVRGLVGGLEAFTEPWAGQLLGGLVVLLAIGLGFVGWRHSRQKRFVKAILARAEADATAPDLAASKPQTPTAQPDPR